MKYAVVRLNGKQFIVSEGEEVLADKPESKELKAEVLLFVDGERVEIGTPTLARRKVSLKIIGEEKGKKLHVLKYKAKSRHRKKIGSRARYTRVGIIELS